jgi:hypothetical protein
MHQVLRYVISVASCFSIFFPLNIGHVFNASGVLVHVWFKDFARMMRKKLNSVVCLF